MQIHFLSNTLVANVSLDLIVPNNVNDNIVQPTVTNSQLSTMATFLQHLLFQWIVIHSRLNLLTLAGPLRCCIIWLPLG